MSLHLQTDSLQNIEPIRTQPTYTFTDLQEIWNLQKLLLSEFKSTEVPFIVLDFENKGFLSFDDFADRFVMKGFPSNPPLYIKFFAFLDTDGDGFINQDDWMEGYKNIGSYLLETRALARDYLKTATAEAKSQSLTVLPSQRVAFVKASQLPAPKTWESAKNLAIVREEALNEDYTPTKKDEAVYIQDNAGVATHVNSKSQQKITSESLTCLQDKERIKKSAVNSVNSLKKEQNVSSHKGSIAENSALESNVATKGGVSVNQLNGNDGLYPSHSSLKNQTSAQTSFNVVPEPVELKPNFEDNKYEQLRVEDVTYYSQTSIKRDNQTNIQDSVITNTNIPEPVEIKLEDQNLKQCEMKLDQILLRSQSSFKNGASIQDSDSGEKKGPGDVKKLDFKALGQTQGQNPSLPSIEASLISKKEEAGSANTSDRSHKNSLGERSRGMEILNEVDSKTRVRNESQASLNGAERVVDRKSNNTLPKLTQSVNGVNERSESAKESSEDAMESVRNTLESERQRRKLSQFIEGREAEHSRVKDSISANENSHVRGGYAPSVTSIAAADEENDDKFETKPGTKKVIKSLGALESTLAAKIEKKNSRVKSTQDFVQRSSRESSRSHEKGDISSKKVISTPRNGSRISLISKSAASQLLGLTPRNEDNPLSDERRGNARSLVIHNAEMSPTELGTPSWKEPVRNFSDTTEEEEDVLLMIEKLLEGHGGIEALKLLQKEDLSRFPHLQTLVQSLKRQGEDNEGEYEERGRGLIQVRKRSHTQSLVELRVRGDLSMEIERDLQRRRAYTPDNSIIHSDSRRQSVNGSRKVLKSLQEVEKTRTQESAGTDRALEVLREKDEERRRKSSVEERKSFLGKNGEKKERVVIEPRKFVEAKKMCKDILDTFNRDRSKSKEKDAGEGIWNSLGYRIKMDDIKVTRRGRAGLGYGWNATGNNLGMDYEEEEDDRKSRLKKVIDQLSEETTEMEARLSHNRLSYQGQRDSLGSTGDRDTGLWGMFRGRGEDKSQPRTPIKSFLRGSVTSEVAEKESALNLSQDQHHVQEELGRRLSSPRLVGKYSKIVADLGSFALRAEKPEPLSRSPLSAVKSSKEAALNLSIDKEFTGRGKTYLLSQITRNNAVNNDFIQANRSLRNAGW